MAGLVPAIHVLCQAFKQILPVGVLPVNETHFPGSRPMLDRFFALYCGPDVIMAFEAFERVPPCETVNQTFAVFIATPNEIARKAGVENTVTMVGHDVNETGHNDSK